MRVGALVPWWQSPRPPRTLGPAGRERRLELSLDYTLLNSAEVFSRLVKLIREARREVWLVSPYTTLGGDDVVGGAIREALKRRVEVNLVFRLDSGDRLNNTILSNKSIAGLIGAGLRVWVAAGVHAKLYWSDAGVLLTSANLLGASLEDVVEVGLWSSERTHVAEARRFYEQNIAPRLVSPSEMEDLLAGRAALDRSTGEVIPLDDLEEEEDEEEEDEEDDEDEGEEDEGFCIRCRESIALDPEKPYCLRDYRVWARYKDGDYEDAFCHACGTDYPATLNKPLCRTCYRR